MESEVARRAQGCHPVAWEDPRAAEWAPEDMLKAGVGFGSGTVERLRVSSTGSQPARAAVILREPESPRCCVFVLGHRCGPASGLGPPTPGLLSAASQQQWLLLAQPSSLGPGPSSAPWRDGRTAVQSVTRCGSNVTFTTYHMRVRPWTNDIPFLTVTFPPLL